MDLFSIFYPHRQWENPDILSCLANISYDEVFTPPAVAVRMLDILPAEIWHDPEATFLDPACKSGVFLREIAKRLFAGLADQIPDEQERITHILHRQIYGIAVTELAGLVTRRTLYCTKYAYAPVRYNLAPFDNVNGNVIFHHLPHRWVNGRCTFCGASADVYNRPRWLENYAYEFIHTLNPEEIFHMKFRVIIGNPPYQMSDGGGNGASAKPIYQLFIQNAKKMNPKYLTMIVPARWFTGGKGLDDFRDEMLHDDRIKEIHDFPEASDCFSCVQIKGGVTYFLWDRDSHGDCTVYSHKGGNVSAPMVRLLLEKGCNAFIRYNKAIGILHKVQNYQELSFDSIVSSRLPFGLPNIYKGKKEKTSNSDLIVYVSGNDREIRGTTAYVPLSKITRGQQMIPWHKVYIAKAGSGSDSFPHLILPKPFYGAPNTVCNESYLVIGPFEGRVECKNVMSYIATKFFRFLVLLKKTTQNAPKGVYHLVPMQDFSKPWTDAELYEKYGLTEDEIVFIESMIKPMDLSGGESDA